MLDVGGQDATEAFEDVGHSDEAREILNGLLVGDLKRAVSTQPPSRKPSPTCFFPPTPSEILPSYPPKSTRNYRLGNPIFSDERYSVLLQEGEATKKNYHEANKSASGPSSSSSAGGLGVSTIALIVVGGVLAFVAYQYLQSSQQGQK